LGQGRLACVAPGNDLLIFFDYSQPSRNQGFAAEIFFERFFGKMSKNPLRDYVLRLNAPTLN